MIGVRMQLAHTAYLSPRELDAVRRLVFAAFDELDEDDWEHCLGGMHALLWEGEELVATGSVVQRRLVHEGRPLRTGYVEGVAVRADRRRRGLGAAVMTELERIVVGAYELGALSSTDDGFALYDARGWRRWRGATYALTPLGVVRTAEDDDAVFVWPVSVELHLDGELTCDFRPGAYW